MIKRVEELLAHRGGHDSWASEVVKERLVVALSVHKRPKGKGIKIFGRRIPWSYAREFSCVAAVGLMMRLAKSISRQSTRETFRKLLAGVYDPEAVGEKERLWIKSLPLKTLEGVDSYGAFIVADSFSYDLRYLLSSWKKGESNGGWLQSEYLSLLQTRDGFEGVMTLLGMAGHDRGLMQDALSHTDKEGELLVTSLSASTGMSTGILEDEWLHRTFAINPDAWWVRPIALHLDSSLP